jgi:hypothetical protein
MNPPQNDQMGFVKKRPTCNPAHFWQNGRKFAQSGYPAALCGIPDESRFGFGQSIPAMNFDDDAVDEAAGISFAPASLSFSMADMMESSDEETFPGVNFESTLS